MTLKILQKKCIKAVKKSDEIITITNNAHKFAKEERDWKKLCSKYLDIYIKALRKKQLGV